MKIFAIITALSVSAIFTFPLLAQELIDDDQVYEQSQVDEIPRFPGGKKAFNAYLDKHLEYPGIAKEKRIEGTVWVEFLVMANGALKDVTIRRNLGSGCEQAVLDMVREMPNWVPATLDRKTVNSKVILPVPFSISGVRI